MIHVTNTPLDPDDFTTEVRKDSNGAVVTFLGTTRNSNEGRNVLYLEYEAYQPMADKTLGQIAQEVSDKWGISDFAIAHRTGRVEIGEISLVVAIASPHREKAFEALKYAVDRIKEIVPIWKKEFFEGGEVWVGSEHEPLRASQS